MYEHEPVTKYYVLHKEAIAFFEKVLKGDRTFLISDDTLHKEGSTFLVKGLKESRTFCPRKLGYILMSLAYKDYCYYYIRWGHLYATFSFFL